MTSRTHKIPNTNLDWIYNPNAPGHVFHGEVVDIEAPIEEVWAFFVKQPNQYARLSEGAIHAKVKGETAVGKDIVMRVYPDKFVGKMMGKSTEKIIAVDDNDKIIGWSRKLPLCLGTTERYQVLKSLGPNLTRSFIALKVPGIVGAVTSCFFGTTIKKAFTALAKGMRTAAKDPASPFIKGE